MRRPWRFIRTTLLLLIASAIVNIAVAWGLVLRIPTIDESDAWMGTPGGISTPQARDQIPRWDFHTKRKFAFHSYSAQRDAVPVDPPIANWDTRYLTARFNIPVAGWSILNEPPSTDGPEETYEESRGWPALSMYFVRFGGPQSGQVKGGFASGSYTIAGLTFPHIFPMTPIWPGFAINTIFYAAILWLLFFFPGKVRRAIRRRRGLCPACAYPVGSSPVCTECGKPVRQRSAINDQQSALDNQS